MIIASCVHSCQWQLFVVLELCMLYTAKSGNKKIYNHYHYEVYGGGGGGGGGYYLRGCPEYQEVFPSQW